MISIKLNHEGESGVGFLKYFLNYFNYFCFISQREVCVVLVIPAYWDRLNCTHGIYEILMLSCFNDMHNHFNA